jgi:hypothetical protein
MVEENKNYIDALVGLLGRECRQNGTFLLVLMQDKKTDTSTVLEIGAPRESFKWFSDDAIADSISLLEGKMTDPPPRKESSSSSEG